MKKHGGTIKIKTKDVKGTTLIMTLPDSPECSLFRLGQDVFGV